MESQLPTEELLYEEEGTTLDFKREQYKFSSATDYQKSELLKDILAFSNAWRRVDAYILIGVEEIKGGRSNPLGIEEELDDAQLQQFINSKTQRPINFNYSTVLIDEVKIGVIKVPVQTRPFYLKNDYGKLKRNVVYIRRGSSTDEASPEEVRDMGRSEIQEAQEIPSLHFEFADHKTRASHGKSLNLNATLLNIPPSSEIPDFYEEERITGPYGFSIPRINLNYADRDYYRDLVKYHYVSNKSIELSFLLRNDSSKVISDIRVEFLAQKEGGKFTFFNSRRFPDFPKRYHDPIANIRPIAAQIADSKRKSIEIQDLGNYYRIEVPFEKAQPKQTVFSSEVVYISVNENFTVDVDITIYADNVPVPIQQKMVICCNVTKEEGSLNRIEQLHDQYLLTKQLS
jgi:hypothetical protein